MGQLKSFGFYISFLAAAIALSACAKGFQTKTESTASEARPGATNTPVVLNTTSAQIFLELAAAQSPEMAALAQKGNLQIIDSRIGFAITRLNSDGSASGQDSVLYLTLTARASDGSTASAMIVSNQAQLAVTQVQGSSFAVEGYWTLQRPGQNMPIYVGLNTVATAVGDGRMEIQGTLFGSFNGSGTAETMGRIQEDACHIFVDTSFIRQLSPELQNYNCGSQQDPFEYDP